MAIAPTRIKVMVLPADGSDVRYETIDTVREEIRPSSGIPEWTTSLFEDMDTARTLLNSLTILSTLGAEHRRTADEFQTAVSRATEQITALVTRGDLNFELTRRILIGLAGHHTVWHFNPWDLQPDIKLLPDIRTRNWSNEEWDQRSVIATGTGPIYHAFFTRSEGRSSPNPRVGNCVQGDVFLLKVSDTEDQAEGKFYYQDLHRGLSGHDWQLLRTRFAAIQLLREGRGIGVELG